LIDTHTNNANYKIIQKLELIDTSNANYTHNADYKIMNKVSNEKETKLIVARKHPLFRHQSSLFDEKRANGT
jgi:hypothetical protein